jgi:small subunit ribosomal protein S4
MGHPRRIRKKYSTPRHPWQKVRIDEEKTLRKSYGVKNKKEIWKMGAVLRGLTTQAKKLVVDTSAQGVFERETLLNRLRSYGLVAGDAGTEEVLGITIENVMDRRLQTLVCKKGLANTSKQARQFITHKHITVGGKKVSSPSYLVTLKEEPTIAFTAGSSLLLQQQEAVETPKVAEKAVAEEKKEEVKKPEQKEKKPETREAGPQKETEATKTKE